MDTVPTAAQRQQYLDDGYTLIRGLIPPELLAPVRTTLLAFQHGLQGWPARHFQVLDPARYHPPDGGPIPGGVQVPAGYAPAFRAVADHPRLQAAMAGLLGGAVTRFTDQALIKWGFPTEAQGGRSFYHQDSSYWKLPPRVGANAWIALDDVGPGAIALAIMPGTQRDWTVLPHELYYDDPPYFALGAERAYKRQRIPAAQVDASREVLVPMAPGDALFFTNYTWHRSEPNTTGRTLCAYAIAYRLAAPPAAAAG